MSNYILEFLEGEEQLELIDNFDLDGFKTNVQSITRTLIDKMFAICDYYEADKIHQNSRHIYDIHQIFSNYTFNRAEFKPLFNEVATDRSVKESINISSQEGYKITYFKGNYIKAGV